MTDIWLKLNGNEAQALAALHVLGFGREMVKRDEDGKESIGSIYDHDVAINFVPNLIIKRGTRDADGEELTPDVLDGPHLMIRLGVGGLSKHVEERAIEQILNRPAMPAGLEIIPDPGTMSWASVKDKA